MVKDNKRSSDYAELQRPLLTLEYEFFDVANELLDKRIEWMKRV